MAGKNDNIEVEEISKIEEGVATFNITKHENKNNIGSASTVAITQKLLAEAIGTFYIVFAGCGSIAVDKIYGSVTFPGICVTWGLIIMVMIYSLAHISGAHFNPAVSITLSIFRRFPLWQVPLYVIAQLIGATLASYVLSLILDVTPKAYFGTVPVGSNVQALVTEIIISSALMFVIFGAVEDNRGIRQLGGIAVGMTITLNALVAGRVSGASMNPARSIGPAIVKNHYQGIWIYVVGPIGGTIIGGSAYSLLGSTDKPLGEVTKSTSFLKTNS